MTCMLYLHLPFCCSKCRYCDFYSMSNVNDAVVNRYIDALAGEWAMHREGIHSISSLFIGGGTPSLLTAAQWQHLSDALFATIPLKKDAEWTIECNPESFTEEKAYHWLDSGVNRITFGVQSMDWRELRILGRAHTRETVERVLSSTVLQRFRSVGIDIMYALPGQTAASLEKTISLLLGYSVVQHVSVYELSITPATPFGKHHRLLPLPHEDVVEKMDTLIMEQTSAHGFERYEVSNYAKKGHRSRHNCGYWDHTPYIGLGASAHSFISGKRFWNVKSIGEYATLVEKKMLPVENEEVVDNEMLAREMIFLGLRNINGIDEDVFARLTGKAFVSDERKPNLSRFKNEGLLTYEQPFWRPTISGLQCADYLARELF